MKFDGNASKPHIKFLSQFNIHGERFIQKLGTVPKIKLQKIKFFNKKKSMNLMEKNQDSCAKIHSMYEIKF